MVTAATVETIKSLVQTIAVAASGLWIAWTFHKLQSVRAAEAKIQNDLRAADKIAAETLEAERRLLSQQPNLEIVFSELLEHRAPDGRPYLAVTVELQNSGARNLTVEFDRATLTVARFDLSDNNLRRMADVYRTGVRYFDQKRNELADLPWRILRAGQERRVVFLAPAPSPGLYLVQFQALYGMLPFHNEQQQDVREDDRIQAVQLQVVSVTQAQTVRPPTRRDRSAQPAIRPRRATTGRDLRQATLSPPRRLMQLPGDSDA